MQILDGFLKRSKNKFNKIYSFLPVPGVSRPVFIVGCGRSGKSTLAGLLSKHKNITYLNEPRHLWLSVFPESDIWTSQAALRHGKLFLDEENFDSLRGKRLSRLFKLQSVKGKGSIVVEELAINNFRLNLIKKIFPDARFIHVYRNGLEVAELIEVVAERGGWFGSGSYKWKKLAEYSMRNERTCELPALCDNFREMGLLEWRLSTEAVVSFLRNIPDNSFFEINSAQIIQDPTSVMSRVFDFLDIKPDAAISTMTKNLQVKKDINRSNISEKEKLLGGRLLLLSMETDEGLTQHYVS
jgi:adenylate kinase family enzyme